MESIYYVLCWHCHRRCKHCYEERFRPYIRDELAGVVAEAKAAPACDRQPPRARLTYLEAATEAGARRRIRAIHRARRENNTFRR